MARAVRFDALGTAMTEMRSSAANVTLFVGSEQLVALLRGT
jgi:hypothetical protein